MAIYFPDGDKERVTRIKVMADYDASTWDHGGCAFRLDSIGAPAELVNQFEEWEASYTSRQHSARFDVASFDAEGLTLAQKLKRFVGAEVLIEYVSEADDETVIIEV